MIINAAPAPLEIEAEPRADGKTHTEGDERAVPSRTAVKHKRRIVNGHVDDLRLNRPDAPVGALLHDFHLRCGLERTGIVSHSAQALDRSFDVGGLVDVGLAKGRGPVEAVVHHVQHGGIVGHGFDADVPGLFVYESRICAGAKEARRLVNLVGKCCGHQHLRKQRVGIERNGSQQIVQLLRREVLVGGLVLIRVLVRVLARVLLRVRVLVRVRILVLILRSGMRDGNSSHRRGAIRSPRKDEQR